MSGKESLLASFAREHPYEASLLKLKDRDPEWEFYQEHKKADPNYWCKVCKIRKSKKNEYRERMEYCWLCESRARGLGIKVAELVGHSQVLFDGYVKGKEM